MVNLTRLCLQIESVTNNFPSIQLLKKTLLYVQSQSQVVQMVPIRSLQVTAIP